MNTSVDEVPFDGLRTAVVSIVEGEATNHLLATLDRAGPASLQPQWKDQGLEVLPTRISLDVGHNDRFAEIGSSATGAGKRSGLKIVDSR
ncbi:hypothetical protein HNR29_004272 [Rhizobium leguminosarum]|nr:hypothetical protein [Rhizobium leguminosarum]